MFTSFMLFFMASVWFGRGTSFIVGVLVCHSMKVESLMLRITVCQGNINLLDGLVSFSWKSAFLASNFDYHLTPVTASTLMSWIPTQISHCTRVRNALGFL